MPDGCLPAPIRGPARFEAYAELVSSLWSLEPVRDDLPRFDYASNLRHLGVAVFGQVRATSNVAERTPGLVARAGLDHIIIYARQSGYGHLKIGGEPVRIDAGDVTFIDLSRPMWTTGTHVDAICIGFPRSMLAPLVADVDSLHGQTLRASTSIGRLAGAHLLALASEVGGIAATEAREVAEATAALLAVCANGGATAQTHDAARVRARPALLVAIRHFLEQNLAVATLGTDTIVRQFGVSRSTLYRLFQPFGGIDSYIRRRRLARAYHTLRSPAGRSGDYVYQVAQAWGFASESAFSHAFRREFDVTPRHVAMGRDAAPYAAEETTLMLSAYLRDLVFQAP